MPGRQSVPRVSLEERNKALDFIEKVVGHELRAMRRGDAVGWEIKLIAEAFTKVNNDFFKEGDPIPDLSRVA